MRLWSCCLWYKYDTVWKISTRAKTQISLSLCGECQKLGCWILSCNTEKIKDVSFQNKKRFSVNRLSKRTQDSRLTMLNKGWEMTQLVTGLLHKYKDLSLNLRTDTKSHVWAEEMHQWVKCFPCTLETTVWIPGFTKMMFGDLPVTLGHRRQRHGVPVASCVLKLAKLASSGFKWEKWLRRTPNINIWLSHGCTCNYKCTHTHVNMQIHMHSKHMPNNKTRHVSMCL